MAHSRGRSFPRSGARRLTSWEEGPFSVATQSISTASAVGVSTGQQALERVTIVRIRGVFTMWVEVATAIGDGFTRVAAGIGIATADVFAIGQTALPTPFDLTWPGWIWHSIIGPVISLTTTEDGGAGLAMIRIPIDTKAMRKFRLNETLFGSVHVSGEIGTATVTFTMDTRVLVKLS